MFETLPQKILIPSRDMREALLDDQREQAYQEFWARVTTPPQEQKPSIETIYLWGVLIFVCVTLLIFAAGLILTLGVPIGLMVMLIAWSRSF